MKAPFGEFAARNIKSLEARIPKLHLHGRSIWVITGATFCFFLRISLWPFGLLEEFGLALAYSQRGLRGFTDILPTFSGRPLALVPSYLGLFLSNGGFAGQYAVAGLVSICQFFAMLWAFSPLIHDFRLRWGLALIVSINPLWPAGFLLRYQSAQLSVLFFIVWLGFTIRSLTETRRKFNWLFGTVALFIGLLSYPGIAIVPFLLLPPLFIYSSLRIRIEPSRQRLFVIFISTTFAVASSTTYTATVAPRIWSGAYEGGASFPPLSGLGSLFWRSQRTLLASRPFLSIFAIGAFLLLRPLVEEHNNSRHVATRSSIATLLLWCSIPLVTVPYFSFSIHLGDQDRVLFPTTFAMILFIAILMVSHDREQLKPFFIIGLVLVSGAMSINSAVTWRREGKLNGLLISQVVEAVQSGGPSSSYVVVDHSGRFGDVYTMLPPYLQIAVANIVTGTSSITLCTAQGVVKRHHVADRFPIGTTEVCEPQLSMRADLHWDFLESSTHVEVYRLKT